MEPRMAIAPIQTVNEAVVKPLINFLSFELPVFVFIKEAKVSNIPSISIISPNIVPSVKQSTINMLLPATNVESVILIIPSIAPATPIKITAIAQLLIIAVWLSSFSLLPNKIPNIPPMIMEIVLIIVPINACSPN